MPVCLKALKWILAALLLTSIARADAYRSVINRVWLERYEDQYVLNTDMVFHLSPIALDALHKGIPLNWTLQVKLQRPNVWFGVWPKTVREVDLQFEIRNHPLMNLYSIQRSLGAGKEVFSSLTAALAALGKVRGVELISRAEFVERQPYQVQVKLDFEHETLPVPLRPMSYFNSDWQLSSLGTKWPLSD